MFVKKSAQNDTGAGPHHYLTISILPHCSSLAKNLVHSLPLSEFINELVHIPDVTHQLVLDGLHAFPVNAASDERSFWVEFGLREESLPVRSPCQVASDLLELEAGKPCDDLVDLFHSVACLLRLGDVPWIDSCKNIFVDVRFVDLVLLAGHSSRLLGLCHVGLPGTFFRFLNRWLWSRCCWPLRHGSEYNRDGY